jgi:hypothetical protein
MKASRFASRKGRAGSFAPDKPGSIGGALKATEMPNDGYCAARILVFHNASLMNDLGRTDIRRCENPDGE